MKRLAFAVFAILLAAPTIAGAQTTPPPSGQNVPPTIPNLLNRPNDFPIPVDPWYGLPGPNRAMYGAFVRSVEVPAQQVVVPVYVPGPGSFSGEYEQQMVEIPGYVVTETTKGFIYPARPALQQVTYGVYQWVTLPATFQPK